MVNNVVFFIVLVFDGLMNRLAKIHFFVNGELGTM